ncbi:MAG: hypothetical protein JOZ39_01070 [Chloroflexi bacterium]|nr:hypothetical protein [Chloroflexota bacterium]
MACALYGENTLKLGIFGVNVSHGCAMTAAEGHRPCHSKSISDREATR